MDNVQARNLRIMTPQPQRRQGDAVRRRNDNQVPPEDGVAMDPIGNDRRNINIRLNGRIQDTFGRLLANIADQYQENAAMRHEHNGILTRLNRYLDTVFAQFQSTVYMILLVI